MAKLNRTVLLLTSAAWLWAAPALAQQATDPISAFLRNLTTGSLPEPAAPVPTEKGTHPLMTPQAIAAATADFGNCLERLWPQAAKRGVSRATYEKYAMSVTPDMRIM